MKLHYSSSSAPTTALVVMAVTASCTLELAEATSSCGALGGCYLYDLEKPSGQQETVLFANTTTSYIYVPGQSRHSILCDVDGTINKMEFTFQPENTTHTSWGAPYWIDGSNGDWVEPSDWLQSCGDKTLVVKGSTWRTTCFSTTYKIKASCGGDDNVPSPPVAAGDLMLRFSKIFKFTAPTERIEPLTPADYPVAEALYQRLSVETTASSVMIPSDYALRGIDVDRYVRAVGGGPTYPNSDPNHPFWDDFRTVVEAQVRRRNNDISDLNLPKIWRERNFNVTDVANAVRGEWPGLWQQLLLESFFKEGIKLDTTVLPFRSKVDFVGGTVRMAALNTWAIIVVSPTTFRMKWMFGRPRPEEVAFAIQDGRIPASAVPEDIKATLSSWNLTKPQDFTGYENGAPRHPAWPGMHGAASSCSFWMMIVFELTEEQKCQALLTDWIVGYGRTVGGVHYPQDNISGMNLAQAILADKLVDHLVEMYGANRVNAQAKVDASRFDWNDFDLPTCKINKSSRRD